jgi:hypothetical protein
MHFFSPPMHPENLTCGDTYGGARKFVPKTILQYMIIFKRESPNQGSSSKFGAVYPAVADFGRDFL